MVESKKRRNERGENRRRADVADDRDALAQFVAGKPTHREQDDRHQDVGWNGAGRGEPGNDRNQNHEYRQRNDADLEIDDRPPAFGPKAFARVRSGSRYDLGVLHHGFLPNATVMLTLAHVVEPNNLNRRSQETTIGVLTDLDRVRRIQVLVLPYCRTCTFSMVTSPLVIMPSRTGRKASIFCCESTISTTT